MRAWFAVPLVLFDSVRATRTGTPVEKVVHLLQDLKANIEKDGEEEKKMYDEFGCWCTKTSDRKATAIHDARDELRQLASKINELKSEVSSLVTGIEDDVASAIDNEKEQKEATEIRQEENELFMAEEAEAKQAMAAMEKTFTILGSAALIQSDEKSAMEVAGAVQSQLAKIPDGIALRVQSKTLSMLRTTAAGLQSKETYEPSYKSLEKILKALDDEIRKDLKDRTKDENEKDTDFRDLMVTKQEELLALHDSIKKQEKKKAETEVELTAASTTFDDVESQMKLDVKFFDEMKESCEDTAEEWEERTSLRQEELDGINEALEILTSDDARKLFADAIKPGKETFLQVSAVTNTPQGKAYDILRRLSAETKKLAFAQLAVQVKTATGGRFDDVIEAIDDIVETLKEEGQSDIDKRDQCKDEYHEIQSKSDDLKWKIKKNDAKIAKLEELIEQKQKEKAQTIDEIESVEREIEEMENVRKEENEAFKKAKKDDEDAISLLHDARDALSKFYKDNDIEMGDLQEPAMLQKHEEPEFARSKDDAPDVKFSNKGKRKGESKGIISLLSMIAEDLEDEVKNAEKAEDKAQEDFEDRLDMAHKQKDDLEDKKENIKDIISDHDSAKSDEHDDKDDNVADLESEMKFKADIKPDCDFITNAFSIRAERRAHEMEGLRKAKAFLKGAKPAAMLHISNRAALRGHA